MPAATETYSAQPPVVILPKTSSPGRTCVTFLPTASTYPAISLPRPWLQARANRNPTARTKYGMPRMKCQSQRIGGSGADVDEHLIVADDWLAGPEEVTSRVRTSGDP